MALDLGEKKIGIALSSTGFLASPWGISKGYIYPEWIDLLSKIIYQERVSLVLVGLPIKQGGVLTNIGKIFFKKTQLLQRKFPEVNWKFVDERGSSQEVSAEFFISKKKSKKINVDSLSAVRILEDFLENKRMSWDINDFVTSF